MMPIGRDLRGDVYTGPVETPRWLLETKPTYSIPLHMLKKHCASAVREVPHIHETEILRGVWAGAEKTQGYFSAGGMNEGRASGQVLSLHLA